MRNYGSFLRRRKANSQKSGSDSSRRGGVYNGADLPSVVFCERRETTEETIPFCDSKMESREVSLEERSAECGIKKKEFTFVNSFEII